MDTPLSSLLQDALTQGSSTTEHLLARLSASAPDVAARGAYWLERELIRLRVTRRLPDGRWEALTEDEIDSDEPEESIEDHQR